MLEEMTILCNNCLQDITVSADLGSMYVICPICCMWTSIKVIEWRNTNGRETEL